MGMGMMKRNECNDTDPGQSVGYFFFHLFAIDSSSRSFAFAEKSRRASGPSAEGIPAYQDSQALRCPLCKSVHACGSKSF